VSHTSSSPDTKKPDSEPSLLHKIANGDQEALEALVVRFQAPVYRLALMVTRDEALAEDILQLTFISAFQNAKSFRGDASEKTWLLKICRNAAFKQMKKRGLVASAPPNEQESPLIELGIRAGWGSESPEEALSTAQTKETLHAALDQLSHEFREVIVLRDIQELSGEDVANILELTLAAMKSRLHRARLHLAVIIREGSLL